MGNRLLRFELAGQRGSELESFYGALFDWEIEREQAGGFDYGAITTGEGETPGGIRHEPEGKPEIVLYFEVDDVDTSLARALELGGKLRIPKIETPEITFALVEDPEGNPIGLVRPNSG